MKNQTNFIPRNGEPHAESVPGGTGPGRAPAATAADNLGAGTTPLARLHYIGTQYGPNGFSMRLYNVVDGPGLCVGTTVTRPGIERRGYTVEEV